MHMCSYFSGNQPSPDYVPGPEYPPSQEFIPKPVYLDFMPSEDNVLPAEEMMDAGDPKESPADTILLIRRDDGDDEDESSDDNDDDDDVDIKEDEEERREHQAHLISIRDGPPTPFWSDTKVVRLLAIPTPPPSPLSPCPSPPPPDSFSTTTLDTIPLTHIIYHSSCDDPAKSRGPIYFPFTTATYHTLPHQSRYTTIWLGIVLGPRYEVGKSSYAPTARPPRGFKADYGFVATMDREIMRDLERDVGYGITDTWDEMLEDMPGAPVTDDTKLGRQMTEFATMVRQDTYEMHVKFGLRVRLSNSLWLSDRLNMLYTDRRAHSRIALLMKREANCLERLGGRSMDASDLACSEVMSLRTTVLGQQAVIIELQAADHRSQAAITKLLTADNRRQAQFIKALKLLKALQTHMTAFQRQDGPAKGPAQPDAPEEAGSSS
ncbi:hypothetical protein Tco_0099263 [Tanacetum coccineum]